MSEFNSGMIERNDEIESIGQQLCQLSNEINKQDEMCNKSRSQEKKIRNQIYSYWNLYQEYQRMVKEMHAEYGMSPNDYPFYANPHLAVLQAKE